jgi:hypothetical protein
VILRLHQHPLAVAHNPSDALADRPAAQRLLQRWSDHWIRHGVGYGVVSWRDDPEVLGFCGVKVMMLRARPVSHLFHRYSAIPAVRSSPGCDRPTTPAPGVALKVGLARATKLNSLGEDGPDWIFASPGWTTI